MQTQHDLQAKIEETLGSKVFFSRSKAGGFIVRALTDSYSQLQAALRILAKQYKWKLEHARPMPFQACVWVKDPNASLTGIKSRLKQMTGSDPTIKLITRRAKTSGFFISYPSRNITDQLLLRPASPLDNIFFTPYYQPLLCYNCLKYGHTNYQCQNKTRCGVCGIEDHVASACESDHPRQDCINCEGKHHYRSLIPHTPHLVLFWH